MKQIYCLIICITSVLVGNAQAPLVDTRDGQTYQTILMGRKTWMEENLNYKLKGALTYKNKKEYGRYYTFDMVKQVCPQDWHLPSIEEWRSLFISSGGYESGVQEGSLSLLEGGGSGFNIYLAGRAIESKKNFIEQTSVGYYWSGSLYEQYNGEPVEYWRVYTADFYLFEAPSDTSEGLAEISLSYNEDVSHFLPCRCVKDAYEYPIQITKNQQEPEYLSFSVANAALPISYHLAKDSGLVKSYDTTNTISLVGLANGSYELIVTDSFKMSDTLHFDISPIEVEHTLGSFTDSRDGQVYATVRINNQTWLAENLRYKTDRSFCDEKLIDICASYGQLYLREEVLTACPKGWRLTDLGDWQDVIALYGKEENSKYENFASAYLPLSYKGKSGLDVLSNTSYHNRQSYMDAVCCSGDEVEKTTYIQFFGAEHEYYPNQIKTESMWIFGVHNCRCIKEE